MKKVIKLNEPTPKGDPIKFCWWLHVDGSWATPYRLPSEYDRVFYTGKYGDWDIFVCYCKESNSPTIYRGHLNSGEY